eukprot:TRINITY_DN2394_c0_g1_i1.p4 TRINITY_DN2394_c0_g1~~TRINITY_DN2394_c0_g1_i1.p4  ORF type:complete len:115 (+),score=9.57 TRINITY_DN2394_c0_g1_i1:1308-1652(+)
MTSFSSHHRWICAMTLWCTASSKCSQRNSLFLDIGLERMQAAARTEGCHPQIREDLEHSPRKRLQMCLETVQRSLSWEVKRLKELKINALHIEIRVRGGVQSKSRMLSALARFG